MAGVEEINMATPTHGGAGDVSPMGSETRARVTTAVADTPPTPGSAPGSAIGESPTFDYDALESAEAAPLATSAAGAASSGGAPLIAEETTAVGVAERAAKAAAEKLAADTAAATASTTAPLGPSQQVMQSPIASLNAALAVLQAAQR